MHFICIVHGCADTPSILGRFSCSGFLGPCFAARAACLTAGAKRFTPPLPGALRVPSLPGPFGPPPSPSFGRVLNTLSLSPSFVSPNCRNLVPKARNLASGVFRTFWQVEELGSPGGLDTRESQRTAWFVVVCARSQKSSEHFVFLIAFM